MADEEKPKRTKKSTDVQKPEDVSDQTWEDFKTLRKSKRAPITPTVIEGYRGEAKKAGITLDEAMRFSIRQGYQGFKADWFRNQQQNDRSEYLPNSKFKRQECRKYTRGI